MESRREKTAISIKLLGGEWTLGLWSLEYALLLRGIPGDLDILCQGPKRYVALTHNFKEHQVGTIQYKDEMPITGG